MIRQQVKSLPWRESRGHFDRNHVYELSGRKTMGVSLHAKVILDTKGPLRPRESPW